MFFSLVTCFLWTSILHSSYQGPGRSYSAIQDNFSPMAYPRSCACPDKDGKMYNLEILGSKDKRKPRFAEFAMLFLLCKWIYERSYIWTNGHNLHLFPVLFEEREPRSRVSYVSFLIKCWFCIWMVLYLAPCPIKARVLIRYPFARGLYARATSVCLFWHSERDQNCTKLVYINLAKLLKHSANF